MRIIGGKFRNKKINFTKNIKTRPLKDSVRENIFNILIHSNILDIEFESLNVLDLYAGSGSFGIECLSRGASNVIFVENYNKVLSFVEEQEFSLGKGVLQKKNLLHNLTKSL